MPGMQFRPTMFSGSIRGFDQQTNHEFSMACPSACPYSRVSDESLLHEWVGHKSKTGC